MATFETKHVLTAVLLHIWIGSLDWNESHEKKAKHIHASAADLLHIRIGNLDWCKCGNCKNEAREIVFVVERRMQCLLLRLKSRSAREASRHAGVMGTCLTVSHTRFLYLPERWVFVCSWCSWTKWARWVNVKFSHSLSGFNQVEWGREMNPRFPFATPAVWVLPRRPTASEAACSVCKWLS